MSNLKNPVDADISGILLAVIRAKGVLNLASHFGISRQAVDQWLIQGYVPIDRADEISRMYDIPLAKLIAPKHLSQE